MTLDEQIRQHLNENALTWYCENYDTLLNTPDEKTLYLSISLATRKVGKSSIKINNDSRTWTIDQAVRVVFLANMNPLLPNHRLWIDRFFTTADQNELVAIYQGIFYLPVPQFWLDKALFAARSNMTSIFLAIAYQNKFPCLYFSEDAWNQLVLKTLCLNFALSPIIGLTQRMNSNLREIFYENVLDQWAANRLVNPELWMCMANHLDEKTINLLSTVLEKNERIEQLTAIWALQHSKLESANKLLSRYRSLQAIVADTGFGLHSVNCSISNRTFSPSHEGDDWDVGEIKGETLGTININKDVS